MTPCPPSRISPVVCPFPSRDTRDPCSEPRVGDIFRDARYQRKILAWGQEEPRFREYRQRVDSWAPPERVEWVHYDSGRSSRWMAWDRWMAWAAGAGVVVRSTDPDLSPSWVERSHGVLRVEVCDDFRTLFFSWGYAVCSWNMYETVHLYRHNGEHILGCRVNRHSWRVFEIVLLHWAATARDHAGPPPGLRLVEPAVDPSEEGG